MQNKKMGVAIIGYGGIARYHHTKWLKKLSDEFEFCGVYDIRPEKMKNAEADGVPTYQSEAELLADKRVELVIVATPNDMHLPISLRAMKAGKGVICEKPVALNSDELEQMIECSKENGVVFTVNQNRRWDRDYITMKHAITSGVLGDVNRIESRVYGSRGIPGDWRKEKAHGGGMVLDWGVHLIDQALMFDESKKLRSLYCKLDCVYGGECDDGFSVTLDFEGGLEYVCEVKTCNFIALPRWYAAGNSGSLIINDWDCNGEIVAKLKEEKDVLPIRASSGMTKTMAPRGEESISHFPLDIIEPDLAEYYLNVKAAIRGQEHQLITHDQLRRSTSVMEKMFVSANENKVIFF